MEQQLQNRQLKDKEKLRDQTKETFESRGTKCNVNFSLLFMARQERKPDTTDDQSCSTL